LFTANLCGGYLVYKIDMDDRKNKPPPKREYPPLYEKIIPIAVGIIVFAILVLLLVIVGVVTGLLPWAG
jgi:hypothetical protein